MTVGDNPHRVQNKQERAEEGLLDIRKRSGQDSSCHVGAGLELH